MADVDGSLEQSYIVGEKNDLELYHKINYEMFEGSLSGTNKVQLKEELIKILL